MKKILLMCILLTITTQVHTLQAQTVTVQPATEFLQTTEAKGIQTVLYVDEKYVTKGWKEFLKQYGKAESPKGSKNVYMVSSGKIPNLSFQSVVIASKITEKNGATTVFYSVKEDSTYLTEAAHAKYASTSELLHDFGVKMYQEQVNREIEVGEKELDKRTRTHSQLVRKGEGLQKDLEDNRKDKISFEEQLVKNHQDSLRLEQEILASKATQKQTAQALEKQKTMMGVLKASLDSAGIVYNTKKRKEQPAEIQAADKELKAREKENDKAIREGESLRKDLEKNARQKTDLQNKLVKNAADKERIPKEIEANLKEQKNAQLEIEKQKKAVDQIRAKLDLIK